MAEQSPFTIDVARIDQEIIRTPQLTRKAGVREAEARHELAQANARLAVTAAKRRQKIRADPPAFGLREKPNNDEVEMALQLDSLYQEAIKEVNQMEFAVGVAKAETLAMIDRRKMVERYVELMALDYFAEKEPHVRSQARQRLEDLSRQAVRGSPDDT